MASNTADDLPLKPTELEFLAGDELVTIVPNFSFDTLNRDGQLIGIGGVYGPFNPNFPVDVPLWLALILNRKQKCRIVPPEWLEVASLKRAIEEEKDSPNTFQPLPFYYLEMAHLLLTQAKTAFQDHYEVRDAFETLKNTRWTKIKTGMESLSDAMTVKLTNLSAGECCLIRGTFQGALDTFQALKQPVQGQTQGFDPTPLSM